MAEMVDAPVKLVTMWLCRWKLPALCDFRSFRLKRFTYRIVSAKFHYRLRKIKNILSKKEMKFSDVKYVCLRLQCKYQYSDYLSCWEILFNKQISMWISNSQRYTYLRMCVINMFKGFQQYKPDFPRVCMKDALIVIC